MRRASKIGAAAAVSLLLAPSIAAAQPADTAVWAALASDRLAADVGDSLTVLIAESATASGATVNSVSRKTSASGEVSSGVSHLVGRGALDLESGFDGAGRSVRSDKMVASISVDVVGRTANGDLLVAGEQALEINGQRTHIRVRGRVRPVDISSANTVLSTRLADAQIEYSGAGISGRAARPGLVSRLLTGFGLF